LATEEFAEPLVTVYQKKCPHCGKNID